MNGFLDLGDSFDSCITATLTLFPIPLALSCRTLNVLSSLTCSVVGAGIGGGDGGDDYWVGVAEQVSGSITFSSIMCCI